MLRVTERGVTGANQPDLPHHITRRRRYSGQSKQNQILEMVMQPSCSFASSSPPFKKIMVYVSWVENTKVYVHGPIEVARAGTTTYYIRGFLKTPRSDRQDCQVHTPEKFSGHGSPRRSEIISFSYAEMTAATMGKPSADLDYLFHTNV